jgi:hypothetical protein
MEPSPPPGPFVAPDHRTPRVLGILNIVFAANIIVCGLCMGAWVAFVPAQGRAMLEAQKKAQDAVKSQREAEIADLKSREGEAKTEDEKQAIRERREALQEKANQVIMPAPDMQTMGFSDPKVVAFMWAELLTNLALNLMMLAAGIGLVMRKRWSPRLGIATAGAKIVRLVLLYGFFALAIVPELSRKVAKAAVAMYAQQGTGGLPGPAASLDFLTRVTMIQYSAIAAGMIVFGVIYPAATIWLLSRPGVRAACSGAKPPTEPSEPW